MSDNINVNPVELRGDKANAALDQSKMLSKICVFVRANFDPDDPIKELKMRLVFPDGQIADLGGALPDAIAKAKSEAKDKGNPLAGIIMRAVLVGVRLNKSGLMRLEADVDSETRLLATMNFLVLPTSSSAH
jgi:hypothetical protein